MDPFGYYAHNNIFYNEKEYGEPFYEDYPINHYNFKTMSNYLVLDPL